MKIIFKVEASKEEKLLFSLLLIITIIVLWFLNSRYLYFEDCEFEDDICSKAVVRAGFLFKRQVELIPDQNTAVSGVITSFNYTVNIIPVVDDEQNPTGEFTMNILKNGNIYKSLIIYKDDYYQKYYRSPLGRIK